MLYGLKVHTIEKIKKIFSQYNQIKKVIIYGSRAKGNYEIGSDIDLTITGDNINLSLLYKIEDDLDELCLPYTFDVSIYNHIKNKNLLEHINRAGMEFYSRKRSA